MPIPSPGRSLFAAACRLAYPWHQLVNGRRTFQCAGRAYRYFLAPYNHTFLNERVVEVPVVMDFVRALQGKEILEVGNVLGHYYDFPHDVVDKFEEGAGILNQDIRDFQSPKRYDLIVAISTLEHVGEREGGDDGSGIVQALAKLRSLLAEGGTIVVTVPVGYNKNLDRMLINDELPFTQRHFLARDADNFCWSERPLPSLDGLDYVYGRFYTYARGVMIGIVRG